MAALDITTLSATPSAIDPANPVVKLCAAGMQSEFTGQLDEARQLFTHAWEAAADDYEAAIAAHYLARHQPEPREALRWNQVALARAEADGSERVQGFYPSLYLNLGYAFENVGNLPEAQRCYTLANDHSASLADGPYAETVRGGIAAGLARVAAMQGGGP